MRHIGTKTIETAQLRLRALTLADTQAMYHNWACDPDVTKYLRWTPHTSLQQTRALLETWVQRYQDPSFYQWGIERRQDGVLMGVIGVIPSEETPCLLAPGYCLGKAFWGQGYMTQALCAVVDYLFLRVGCTALACSHAVENPASGRVMQKIGFVPTHTGTFYKFDGTPVACVYYLLQRDSFKGVL